MTYRKKITVDGKDYRYTVGRTHVKVDGVGAATRETVGQLREYETECSCGSPDCHFGSEVYTKLAVQPSDVAEWIRKQNKK